MTLNVFDIPLPEGAADPWAMAARSRCAGGGCSVFAVDVNPAALEETVQRARHAGGEIVTRIADLTASVTVRTMAEACHAAFRWIDALVNCIGGSPLGGCVQMEEEVFDAQVAFNLKSVFHASTCCRSCSARNRG